MGLLSSYFNNTRKPTGLLGKLMLGGMNAEHAAVSDWGLSQLGADPDHPSTGEPHSDGLQHPLPCPSNIADLGCGGGRNAAELLRRFPDARLTAVDYSPEAIAKAERLNRREVAAGRCSVLQGDVSSLPLPDGQFDLATAFETVYFWPGPVQSFREVCRILAPGGIFLVVNESDGLNPGDEKWLNIIDGLAIYTQDELVAYLQDAGFANVRVHHDNKKHWLCLVAQKASS